MRKAHTIALIALVPVCLLIGSTGWAQKHASATRRQDTQVAAPQPGRIIEPQAQPQGDPQHERLERMYEDAIRASGQSISVAQGVVGLVAWIVGVAFSLIMAGAALLAVLGVRQLSDVKKAAAAAQGAASQAEKAATQAQSWNSKAEEAARTARSYAQTSEKDAQAARENRELSEAAVKNWPSSPPVEPDVKREKGRGAEHPSEKERSLMRDAPSAFSGGEVERAISLYDEVLRLNEGNWAAWADKGSALVKLERYPDALACFNQALALLPESLVRSEPAARLHQNRALAYFNMDEYHSALDAIQVALGIDPTLPDAAVQEGVILLNRGREKDALEAFRRPGATTKHMEYLGLLGYATALRRDGQLEESRKLLEEAVRRYPDQALGYAELGTVVHLLGDHREAIRRLQKAVDLDPGQHVAWYNLACAHARAGGDKDSALRTLEQAIKVDPRWREVARADTDFGALSSTPEFRRLVGRDEEGGTGAPGPGPTGER